MDKRIRKTSAIDLSIVITAHNEGLIAHKTLLSISRATKSIPNLTYEIIVSVDSGDETTSAYFKECASKIPELKVLEVNFKGLSESRNNAAQHAKGSYIAFVDADDLVSSNWLQEGYRIAKDTKGIVHPEYSITFGDDNLIWKKQDSSQDINDTLCMIDNNLWDSPLLALRSIILSHPYTPNGNGYGYEDRHFNSETLAAGIPHYVAPHTILFVRRKQSGSMLVQSINNRVTLAPTRLLSYDNLSSINLSPYIHDAQKNTTTEAAIIPISKYYAKKIAKKIHTKAKQYPLYISAIQPLREKRQNNIRFSLNQKFPTWMLEEWRAIHRIDNTIFPSQDLLKNIPWYNAENIKPGLHYTQLTQKLSAQPDTLFFVPHLIKGGADLLFVNYPNELIKLHPKWHIAMLQTEAKESVWRSKLSPEIDFIDLFTLFAELDVDTQYRLLATFVTQNNIKRIIIGNSQLAYNFVAQHETLIKRLNISIYCFAFGEEFDEEGRLWGHIHTGIPKIYQSIHRIITDNRNTVDKLVSEYSFDPDKFRVHYQPTAVQLKAITLHNRKPLRILWASRVCKQKRPDIIRAISNRLSPQEFTIDVWGQLEEGLTEKYFENTQINYRGAFNGIDTLPTSDYDIYVYTSEGDGVPNMLQEMTAAGLPIVASNVGGIKEFIVNNKTGFLIVDHEKIAAI